MRSQSYWCPCKGEEETRQQRGGGVKTARKADPVKEADRSSTATSQGTTGSTRSWRRQGWSLLYRLCKGSCQYLDFKLPASRTVRQWIVAVSSPPGCGTLYGSLVKSGSALTSLRPSPAACGHCSLAFWALAATRRPGPPSGFLPASPAFTTTMPTSCISDSWPICYAIICSCLSVHLLG